MKILGISAFYHDSAAAVIDGDNIIAAAQEERFTRKKHDPSFPVHATKYCLEQAGWTIDELDAVVFYDKPLLKFERLLETYYSFAPKGFKSFITSIPVWLKEKMFLKRLIHEELAKVGLYNRKTVKLLFPEHHLSHAASAFYPSPYEDAAILTVDGVGEWATASICYGKGKDIKILKELRFPHSVGLLYSAFTYFLGFKVNSGEYKLMGLAPYGNPNSDRVKKFIKIIKTTLIDIKPDGSLWLNQEYFNYATGLRMVHDKKWEKLFGFPRRNAETDMNQAQSDLGMAIQKVTEEIVILMAKEAQRLTGSKNLCMAGGVALNCVANGKLVKAGVFENIFIQPAAGDAGGALGAAQVANYIYFKKERKVTNGVLIDSMKGSYLGPEASNKEIEIMARKTKAVYKKYDNFEDLCKYVAKYIDDGAAIGWMQGRMEFGPRALGGRSIIGDPRNSEMQEKMNLKIKYRESFRPFAPSILAEDVEDWFDHKGISPYMLLVQDVAEKIKKEVPANYHDLPQREKLYTVRSTIPAITHIDFSARIQTVHEQTNPKYHQLISAFKKLTGCPVIINTSFNVRGEPIVNTPEDAYRCFMRTEMDYLVIGNYVFVKKEQPDWTEKDKWKDKFILD
ncbi:MAG: carbamoyltransferase [Saprospiraceae bacterium]|nr:carbamoyltransferase [Saprospiraceae bacterium]MDC3210257.1 carbamoyltransferase [Saprospiraceae bacterium]MDC3253609.1 carbamoyltransferase [bacterium]MDG1434734.1 carbamoyltransferase [Saprospiraceae bacterium]MDG2418377.1 carbamoyltransferase [Saprospiraceae bacterium]